MSRNNPVKDAPALSLKHVSVCYGTHEVLEDINLAVADRSWLGIIGPNGGGKSTLLKAILGLIPILSGSILVFGNPPGKNPGLVGYVPQVSEFDKAFPITVEEAVLTARINRSMKPFFSYTSQDHKISQRLLDRVGLADLAGKRIGELSGGEFQKMLIARALAVQPRILLLDEPTANVDASASEQVYDVLRTLKNKIAIVMVTHDMLAISSHIDQLACLNRKLIYHGEPHLDAKTVSQLYGCPVDLIAHGVPHRVLKSHEEDH
jgi:zinc transport system ATP-binding protein